MDAETKELVAIGASIAGHCQPCLQHHLERARQLGIIEDDIAEAVLLAKKISETGDKRMMEWAETLLETEEEERPREKPSVRKGRD